jgi:hypothetical protein
MVYRQFHILDSDVTTYNFILRQVPAKYVILLYKITKKVHTFTSGSTKPVSNVTTINCDDSTGTTINLVYRSEMRMEHIFRVTILYVSMIKNYKQIIKLQKY